MVLFVINTLLTLLNRYDFWIEATDPQELGNYWIRAETLEMYQNEQVIILMSLEL